MSLKNILTIIIAFFCFNNSNAQNWLNHGGGPSNDESFDVEIDNFGNIYSTGYVSGSIAFGNNISLTANSFSDIYVSKSDSDGEFLWVKTFGGSLSDRATDIFIGQDNNIYITGYYQGTANFDSEILVSDSGSRDFFLAKLNPNGDVIWVVSQGGEGAEIGNSIAVGPDNNPVVTGEFSGTSTIGNQSFTSAYDVDEGEYSKDIFVAKYNSFGQPIWAKQGSSDKNDRGLRVDIAPTNEIFISGQLSDTLNFDGTTINNAIENSGYIAKLNATGNIDWFQQLAAYQVNTYDLVVDGDRIYITGEYLGQMLILTDPPVTLSGNYTYRIFTIRFDSNGGVVWANHEDSDSNISSKAIAIDSSRDVYIAGEFRCRFDGFSDLLQQDGLFYSVGHKDVFIAKYAGDLGERIWYRQYGGVGQDNCSGLAVQTPDNPVISGGFENEFYAPFEDGSAYTGSFTTTAIPIDCDPFNILYKNIVSSANLDVFIGKPFQENAPHMFCFNTSCYDFEFPSFTIDEDSVAFCEMGVIQSNTNTFGNGTVGLPNVFGGPLFDFSWNTGWTNSMIEVETTGLYILETTREDFCYSHTDSIFVQVNPIPELPFLTDDAGFNTSNSDPYADITTCGDSVLVLLEVEPNSGVVSISSSSLNFIYTEPFYINEQGTYTVHIEDEEGCFYSDSFFFHVLAPEPPIAIDPYLLQNEGLDSVVVCSGESVPFSIYDGITNPDLNLELPYCNALLYPDASSPVCIETSVTPIVDGWYTASTQFIIGYDNLCGIDSTLYYVESDSVYITVNPTPGIWTNIFGDTELCPGDTNNVWVDNLIDGFNWSGPGIVTYSNMGDTIGVISNGSYHYAGTFVDDTNGCSASGDFTYTIIDPQTPLITSNIPDNIICPGDSLLLTCENSATYSWVGPDGNFMGAEQTVYADQPGFYFCVVEDFDGCSLVSNTLELIQYQSPFVIVDPLGELCITGSVTLSTIVAGAPSIWWDAPINSSDPEITVTEAGNYTVTVEQCGITFSETIYVDDNSFVASIEYEPALTACVGDEIILTANDDMISYNWSNGENTQSIVVTESGFYSVETINPALCEGFSEEVEVIFFSNIPIPEEIDVTICSGDEFTLISENVGGSIWYNSNEDVLGEGSSITLNNIVTNTVLTYSNVVGLCSGESNNINITVNELPEIPIVDFPDESCEGDIVSLEYLNWNQNYSSWESDLGTSNSGLFTLEVGDSTIIVSAINTNSFGCLSSSDIILEPFSLPSSPILSANSPLCDGDTLLLESMTFQTNIETIWSDNNANTIEADVWNYGTVTTVNSGDYFVSLTNDNGCILYDTLLVTINPFPILNLDLDTNYCFEVPLEISAPGPFHTYFWSTGSEENEVTIYNPGTYTLEVSSFQCFVTDSFTITSIDCDISEFPNVFTPNADGMNDLWSFQSPIIETITIDIYNRWGTIVGQLTNKEMEWDGRNLQGKELSEGTYFFVANFKDYEGIPHKKSGYITLKR